MVVTNASTYLLLTSPIALKHYFLMFTSAESADFHCFQYYSIDVYHTFKNAEND